MTVSGTVGFGYDADLRLSGLSVNGDTVEYGYDDDGLLTVAGALTLTRDASNGLLTETALENVATRMTYDGFGEPTADSAWVGATLVYARTYERDALGRLTDVVDASDGTTTVWGYGYDAVGRLETVTRDSVAYASYVYDANGNRLTRTTGSGTETGTYDAQDRLTSYGGATYTYTAAGELAERVEGADTTRYDYDALGNLVEVELPDGTVVAYTIDGRNRRVGRSVDGAVVQGLLYGDQLNPVAELDSAGVVVSRFVYGTKANVPDYVVRGGATYRVLSDHLGSVRLVVDATTGSVAQRLSYDAWGRVLEDTSPGFQPFGFAGGISDPLTGLVRFGARDYDPAVGRWTAKDPIRFLGGGNLYEYMGGGPVNGTDVSGLCPWERCGQEAIELGLSVALDFAGLKLARAAGRLGRLGVSSGAAWAEYVRLSAVVGDDAAAEAFRLAQGSIHRTMVRESLAAAPLVPLTQAGDVWNVYDEAVGLQEGAGLFEIGIAVLKTIPFVGSGLELGELLNCLGFG